MRLLTTLIFLVAAALPGAALAEGHLVIVGGGLKAENAAVYRAFLDARPAGTPRIVIIPAASGEASASAEAARDALVKHGASVADIAIAQIAMKDDPGTRTVDESRWARNVDSEEELARLENAGAIWFTGGDQSRITGLLLTKAGDDTPYLSAIRARYAEGAVIGGTSAGAAIMSGAMITQGDSMGALLPGDAGEDVGLARGLHFLRNNLIDQHFGERARLGRLAVALIRLKKALPIGLGIDENTALVVAPGQRSATILGAGYVTVLNAAQATASPGEHARITGLVVGLAGNGDEIDLTDGSVKPAWYRKDTKGREYFERAATPGGGMAVPGTMLADVIDEALMDNAEADEVVRYSFSGDLGVAYRFGQTDASRAAWGRDEDGKAAYSISGVRFDIEPISVSIQPIEDK